MAGIYIHIPFCKKACSYCDFHFSTNLNRKQGFCKALGGEIELQKGFFSNNTTLQSLYFGGGTPSLLNETELTILIHQLKSAFSFSFDFEFTLECNPDDLNPDYLKVLRRLGVNRLSIGVQSFRESDLLLMNRSHNADQAEKSIVWALDAGFKNLTVDLIYGIPGLSLEDWEMNVKRLVQLGVHHVSAYALTVEEKTALSWRVKNGLVKIPADEHFEAQFFHLIDCLQAAGFEHYELSNFALPGHRSQHNSAYWAGDSYLGLGPSAHSFRGKTRSWNIANNVRYLKQLAKGELPLSETEILTPVDQVNEYLMTQLRTTAGIHPQKLKSAHGHDIWAINRPEIESFIQQGWMEEADSRLRLTRSGMLLSNAIISNLFLEN